MPAPTSPPAGQPVLDYGKTPRAERFDRWGARVAWLVIFGSIGFTAYRAADVSAARAAFQLQQGQSTAAKTVPAHVLNPQLAVQAKAAVASPLGASGPQSPEAGLQLREAAKTPAERVWIVPAIVEIEGTAAGLAELEKAVPRTTSGPSTRPVTRSASAATGPATTSPATSPSADAPPASTALPASAVARDAAALRTIYERSPDALSPADRARLVARLGWAGRLALTNGKPSYDADRAAVLEEAQHVVWAGIGTGLTGCAGLIAGLVLLIWGIYRLANRRLVLRYAPAAGAPLMEESVAAAGPTSTLSSDAVYLPPAPAPWTGAPSAAPTLPPAWSTYQPPVPPVAPVGQPALGYQTPPQWSTPPGMYPLAGYAPGSYAPYPQQSLPTYPPGWSPQPLPPPYRLGALGLSNGRTGPFLEAFAVYLVLYLGLASLVFRLLDIDRAVAQWVGFLAIPAAVAWPRLRGVPWAAWRRGFGLSANGNVFREVGAGVVAYLAGLPLVAAAALLTAVLIKVGGATPYHPIQDELTAGGGAWPLAQIYLLAAVAAPIAEELMFRGALFHHLRTRWSWVVSALTMALAFAAVHPQGWSAVPVLGSIAVVFAALREWRGGIVASVVAHGLHNAMAVTISLLVMG